MSEALKKKVAASSAQPVVLREADVLKMLGVSDSTLARMVKRGEFVPPVKLGPKLRVWLVEDVTAWTRGLKPAA